LAHEQTFQVKCTVPLIKKESIGTGISRKKAEQAAAEQMLQLINEDKQ
jgi:ribonuclease III